MNDSDSVSRRPFALRWSTAAAFRHGPGRFRGLVRRSTEDNILSSICKPGGAWTWRSNELGKSKIVLRYRFFAASRMSRSRSRAASGDSRWYWERSGFSARTEVSSGVAGFGWSCTRLRR